MTSEEEEYPEKNFDIKGGYKFLERDDINKKREEIIKEFILYSNLSEIEAELVLMNNNWNIEVLLNDWYDNTQKLKEKSGIAQTSLSQKQLDEYFQNKQIPENYCLICETEIDLGDSIYLGCNHKFCSHCFSEYLKDKVKDQLTLLATKCPQQHCNFQVNSDIFKKIFPEESNERNIYNRCLIRNFTESNADVKLCPNPRCDNVIELPGHGMVEIKCRCGLSFCFKCLRESHRPCDCDMKKAWEEKNKADSEKTKLIIVNIKQCPNCLIYISKNQGCNHMTCRKEAGGCGYEFCWVCLGEWKQHSSDSYVCKKPPQGELFKNKEKIGDFEITPEFERYAIFFEDYQEEEKSVQYAKELKEAIKADTKMAEFFKNYTQNDEELFLYEAVNTVIEFHQILKNIHIYEYFMKSSDSFYLFMYQQEMLRRNADLLHEKIDIEIKYLYDIIAEDNWKEFVETFNTFKEEVQRLIDATQKFKEKILEEIEGNPESIDYKNFENISLK